MLLCFVVAVAWRIPVIAAALQNPMANDEPVYHGLALRLLNGLGFTAGHGFSTGLYFTDPAGTPTAWRTPGLPAVLAGIYWIAGEAPAVARVILAVASSLTAPALYGLCLRMFERRSVAFLAGLGWAVLLNGRQRAASILPEPLATLLLTVALLLTVDAARRRSTLLAALAGVLLAYAVLTRGFLVLGIIGPLAWLVVQRSRRLAMAMLLTVAVILSAWALRNEVRLGAFTLTTQTQELWLGNNAWARGSFQADWPPQKAYLLAKYPDLDQLDEVRRSRFFVREAVDEIASHPARILWLLPRKALVFFSYTSYLGADWVYAGLLPFALLGTVLLAAHRRHRPTLWLLGVPVVGALIICLLAFGDPRFRMPVDPLIVGLASVGLHGLASRLALR